MSKKSMSNYYKNKFISNFKAIRENLGLSEKDIDILLKTKTLTYTGLETNPKRVLSLDFSFIAPTLFGLEIQDLLLNETPFVPFDKLPNTTQNYITHLKSNPNKSHVGKKESKNIASHVVVYLSTLSKGSKFINSEVTAMLPPPLNKEISIDWSSGILKGLVKNTKTYRKKLPTTSTKDRGEAVYELLNEIDPKIIEKALNKVNPEWLKEFEEKCNNVDK